MPVYKKYDKDFFKTWSHGMAYVLGFLYADGNLIQPKRGGYYIAFYSGDQKLLSSMRDLLKSNHRLSLRSVRSGDVYRIQIGSKEMFHDLVNIGLSPDKSSRLKVPDIPHPFVSDFLRGYFDGDGNVWTGYPAGLAHRAPILQVSYTSISKGFLSGIHEALRSLGIDGGSIFRVKNKNAHRLTLSTNDALKIYKIMYTDPRTPFLARKKLVFERFMRMRS
jgi:hypothetical protein